MSLILLSAISHYLGVPIWITASFVIIALLYYFGTKSFSYFSKMGIKHPRPYPWIGNFGIFIKDGFTVDRQLIAKYGKIFGLYECRTPVLVIADAEMIKEICIKEFSHFVNRRVENFPMNDEFESALSIVKDAEWKGMRNVITPTFSASKMKRITPLIVQCADELVKAIGPYADQKKELEIKGLSGCYTMDVVANTQFGIKVNSQTEGPDVNEFVRHARRVFEGFSPTNFVFIVSMLFPFMARVFEKFGIGILDNKACKFFKENIYRIVDMRTSMKEKPVDFLQLMLEAHNLELDETNDKAISYHDSTSETNEQIKDWRVGKRALSKQEILSNALLFFTAGYETTATAMTWTFYLLSLHPEIQDKLYKEIEEMLQKNDGKITYDLIASMPYMDQVFCEALRLYPPAQRTDRVCQEEVTIEGYQIPKGQIVNLSVWGIHYSPEYWPEPEKFDPERFSPENKETIVPYSYIPFGAGPRNCVGMRLAILEAKIGILSVIHNFRMERSENTEVPPKLKKAMLTLPVNGIKLRASRR